MAADGVADSATRLEDWIPLDFRGKPLYHGIDETERMNHVRPLITAVRKQWNTPEQCSDICRAIRETIKAKALPRELRLEVDAAFQASKFWADDTRSYGDSQNSITSKGVERYDALQLYTSNAGYKSVFGYINQVFRKEDVDDHTIQGAVALVELLTIDIYNLRLDNYGSAHLCNFQGLLHRGMTVTEDVLEAFYTLLKQPLKNRNFSVPLTFVSASTNQKNIQEFLNKTEKGKHRLHWKIHVRELHPRLLSSYRQQHPASIVSTVCAMPISHVSEFPNEQEVLLRGPLFQLLRIYDEPAADHTVHVLETVMLNANRDHSSELAYNHGGFAEQRILFGRMCQATKYEVCAALAQEYGLQEAAEYTSLYKEVMELVGWHRIKTPLSTVRYDVWATPRPSWIGATLKEAFPKFYVQRRDAFSKALFGGKDWPLIEQIIEDEYDWQQADWCNVTRLYEETSAEAANASGFTALHQASYNNASPARVQKLVGKGAWRTLKANRREGYQTAEDIASRRSQDSLTAILKPKIHHSIEVGQLEKMEQSVHDLMRELSGDAILQYAVRLPQLCVLTELDMAYPSLWVPIPSIHGGYVITLQPDSIPSIDMIYVSHAFPRTERRFKIHSDGKVDHYE